MLTGQRIASAWRDLVALAYPADCPACGQMLSAHESRVCLDCQEAIATAAARGVCDRCAAPLPDEAGPCGRCRGKGIPLLDRVVKLTPFSVQETRELIHAVKYGHRWPMADWLADQLLHLRRAREVLDAADVIVPVPLHWRRQFGRGFNQATLLARRLAKGRKARVVLAVRKRRSTKSQTAFHSRVARQLNVRGAFAAKRPGRFAGQRVVIVDDVMTSGATIQAVARALRVGGRPASISAIVVAAADPLHGELSAT